MILGAPSQSEKLTGLGLACPELPEALKGGLTLLMPYEMITGPRVPHLRPLPVLLLLLLLLGMKGKWNRQQQGGAQEGKMEGKTSQRQVSAGGLGWAPVKPLPLQDFRLECFLL